MGFIKKFLSVLLAQCFKMISLNETGELTFKKIFFVLFSVNVNLGCVFFCVRS